MSQFYETVARYYDAEVGDKRDDLMMYHMLAETVGGPVLDVGCGTGRVLLHLAASGIEAHGVDDSPQMLQRLQAHLDADATLHSHITYEQADILSYTSDAEYGLICLSYNAMMHFHTLEAQIQLLEVLHPLLRDDGLLVIDLPNAGETFASPDSNALLYDRTFVEPETGHTVMVQSYSLLDRVEQLMHVEWFYDEIHTDGTVRRLIVPHVMRYLFFSELSLLLERCGFAIDAVYGDVDGSEFIDGSERMIVYASRAD